MLIWQLGTDEFPPLRTLDELPGNLPVQRTSFIGRVRRGEGARRRWSTNERLVTLTGPGGVGKSRLALQVAAEVAPAFDDGVWFASLAALEEGALVGRNDPRGVGCARTARRTRARHVVRVGERARGVGGDRQLRASRSPRSRRSSTALVDVVDDGASCSRRVRRRSACGASTPGRWLRCRARRRVA